MPNKATTLLGFDVYRRESIYVPEYGRDIPCAPYDNHFIYEIPKKYRNTSSFMCTCGSFAVVTGFSGYNKDASPSGLMLVCHHHATFGVHSTGENKWI
jgi:hypothetical protein